MQFIFPSVSGPIRRRPPQLNRHHRRFLAAAAAAAVKLVRDRALDHAVEKEKNLRPLINLKNLLKSEPSKSLPVSIIADRRDALEIPIRPVDFVRRYRSVFEEFLPGGIGVHPHVRLTPEALELDAEEQLIYQSDAYQKEAADRLLKLLMLCRINKVPLKIVDRLKWDLGLPEDYAQSLVPQFPDYFQVSRVPDSLFVSDVDVLELVCWSSNLAVSVIEKKASKGGSRSRIGFPLQYSRGFEVDKSFKKWASEWQKLPYISPYENAMHLPAKCDESDKWAVAVMHELLHILIPKKTEKENILCLGEHMGLRSRFKRALLQHPGIFYVSSKNRTHTVVLREGYKRDLLTDKHQMMAMRYRYIHLMNSTKEAPKASGAKSSGVQLKQTVKDIKKRENEEEMDGGRKDEENSALAGISASDAEDAFDGEYDDTDVEDDDSCEEDEHENRSGDPSVRSATLSCSRTMRKGCVDAQKIPAREKSVGRYPSKTKDKTLRKTQDKSFRRYPGKTMDSSLPTKHRQAEMHHGDNVNSSLSRRSFSARGRGKSLPEKRALTR